MFVYFLLLLSLSVIQLPILSSKINFQIYILLMSNVFIQFEIMTCEGSSVLYVQESLLVIHIKIYTDAQNLVSKNFQSN